MVIWVTGKHGIHIKILKLSSNDLTLVFVISLIFSLVIRLTNDLIIFTKVFIIFDAFII